MMSNFKEDEISNEEITQRFKEYNKTKESICGKNPTDLRKYIERKERVKYYEELEKSNLSMNHEKRIKY